MSKNAMLEEEGFAIIRNLLTEEEVFNLKEHFLKLRAEGAKPGDKGGNPNDASDPLNRYPRFIDMHNWDSQSQQLVDLFQPLVKELTDSELRLFRTMVYFKPPGARGVAFHQDERYSDVKNLTALWIALDRCDEENGCLNIVPKSHREGLQEVDRTDSMQTYFTAEEIKVDEVVQTPVILEIGDAVVFDGMTVHGSKKNDSNSFRISFIIHYERVSE